MSDQQKTVKYPKMKRDDPAAIRFFNCKKTSLLANFSWKNKNLLLAACLFIPLIAANVATAQHIQNYNTNRVSAMPEELRGYLEPGFTSTDTPDKSPFGGECREFTTVSSGYYSETERCLPGLPCKHHEAFDLVPKIRKDKRRSEASNLINDTVLFATIDGSILFDKKNGNTVRIINKSGTLEVGYAHLKTSFVKTGNEVVAGIPIGIMGSTGNSTAPHVHFWVATIDPSNDKRTNKFPGQFIWHEDECGEYEVGEQY